MTGIECWRARRGRRGRGDLEEEEDQYYDEETNAETIEEEPDFTSGSNYEPACESEEDATMGIQMLTKFLNRPA